MPPTLSLENQLLSEGYTRIAGVDEAGRGCLAGPVVAAAVVLPRDVVLDGLDDSKKVRPDQREQLAREIRRVASVSVGICSEDEIDELNILWAAMEAMRRAVFGLRPHPDYLLIDGNRAYPDCALPHQTVVKGDARSSSIAAASIIAKTERDRIMRRLHKEHPEYHWMTNKGYPTPPHFEALEALGPTPYHRRSFKLARGGSA